MDSGCEVCETERQERQTHAPRFFSVSEEEHVAGFLAPLPSVQEGIVRVRFLRFVKSGIHHMGILGKRLIGILERIF